ncbi:MAG: amidase [Alphaproteobacteria bacterium]|nr:amidase [Alphaproteobacteria bacterium]MDP6564382.1 amidase [Alphaproteobacteria bacterium]
MTVQPWHQSAGSLAEAIREKRLSSQEVIQAHLDRIRAVNSEINAVTVVLEEDALRLAREADQKIAAGEDVGPLHGVPITVKENIDLVGSATTHGIVALKDAMPSTDAPVVTHLKRAGAIPIGRTNLPDFGLRWHTANNLHGATRNPWDPTRTSGGSSGGEAAAIATGMSPLGIGNDMGGSLRYPAQCCGITAIRPSLGRVSRIVTTMLPDPPMFYEQVAAVNGPLARHVRDLRLALEVMSRADPGDPCWTPAPRLGSAMPTPIRVALTIDPAGDGCAPAIAAGIRRAADILADAGYVIEEAEPPSVPESADVLEQISVMEIAIYLPAMRSLISEEARTVLDWIVADITPDLGTYMGAIARRHDIARDWNGFMQRYPLVLGPISTLEPFEVGHDLAGPEQLNRFIRSIRLTETCNLLGLPAVAVPVQLVDGLPQAAQLIGPRFHEDLCLDAAEIIEQRQGVLTPIEPQD